MAADQRRQAQQRDNALQHEVIVYCKANPGKKIIEAIDVVFKLYRTENNIKLKSSRSSSYDARGLSFFMLSTTTVTHLNASLSKENVMKKFCINAALAALLVGLGGF